MVYDNNVLIRIMPKNIYTAFNKQEFMCKNTHDTSRMQFLFLIKSSDNKSVATLYLKYFGCTTLINNSCVKLLSILDVKTEIIY